MKFTSGMWIPKKGYEILFPKSVYTADIEEKSLVLYAPFTQIERRGDTLGGILTICLFAPRTGIIGVSIVHHLGSRRKKASFELETEDLDAVDVRIEETETQYIFSTGKAQAKIEKNGAFRIAYYYDGNFLTMTQGKSLALINTPDKKIYMREQLDLSADENIYGLGERFTAFVKNGQTVDIWNEDGGTDSEQSYKNIPFFLSSNNYGIFVNSTDRVSFEIASEIVSKTQFSVPGERLEYYVIGGDSPKSVLSLYTDFTGKPSLPPAWSFGLWLTTSFTTDYSEETVMHFIDGMLDRGIPLSVFHFDCFWMKEYEWCNFLWDERFFPDPQGMISRIHDKGVKVCVWINPYIGQKSQLFKEGYENNYFVNTGAGDVWQWDLWQAGMALVDFTNPDAVKWYQSKLQVLVDMGVDSFKTDFGERIPEAHEFYGECAAQDGISYANGHSPESMHNYYTYLYNKAVFEVLEKAYGVGQACLFARSATVGGQKFPAHWGGDCLSTYASMAESLRAGLSLGLSGFAFWSHDIGGFEAGCEPDIYKRWTQFGLLSSHSRYHGNQEYKVPWLYDEEAVTVSSEFTRLKLRLMPYLFKIAAEACETGIPVLRPMFLEFPEDKTCQKLDLQYMLGEAILVAPVFNPDGVVDFYLPEGKWTHLISEEVLEGPRWYKETYSYHSLPVFVREKSILVFGQDEEHAEYVYNENITAKLYGRESVKTGDELEAWIYGGDGVQNAFICARADENNSWDIRAEGLIGSCKFVIAGDDFEMQLPSKREGD